MKTINKISQWDDFSPDYGWMDFFRFFLGSFLFYVGMYYAMNPQYISQLVSESRLNDYFFEIKYVPLINIIGGIMIAFGFKTRWAVAFQIPVLIGAISLYLITGGEGLIYYSELVVSILVFGMFVGFLISGSGSYSVDGYLAQRKNKNIVHSNKYKNLSHF